MERKISFAPEEYYHIYNRGVDRRKIFLKPRDYQRFLSLLYLTNSDESIHLSNLLRGEQGFPLLKLLSYPKRGNLVAIGAFCLMPNHFHLLLKEIKEGGISQFMLKLQTSYSMYFNLRNDRSGALFQGIFKAEHVDQDDYLKYLFSYIHLNPAKLVDSRWKEKISSNTQIEKLFNQIESYPYSSCRSYLNLKQAEEAILNKEVFPDYFAEAYRTELVSWLEFNKD